MSFHEFCPGDGTRYTLHLRDAEYGGVYVICNETTLWRYHQGDSLKFLCGDYNLYTSKAIWNYLEALE